MLDEDPAQAARQGDSDRRPGERRNPPRRELILEAAERLFAKHGFDGVSLRQIAVASGSSNHVAVQYHFGDKDRLVRAIFERRLASVDAERGKRMARLRAEGKLDDPRSLLDALLTPFANAVDASGVHSYAAFILGVDMFRIIRAEPWAGSGLSPCTTLLLEMLAASVDISPALFWHRSVIVTKLYLGALQNIDRSIELGLSLGMTAEALLEDALDSGFALLTAPVSPNVARALEASHEEAIHFADRLHARV